MVRNLLTRRRVSPWAFFLLLWLGFALAGCVQQPLLVANVTPAAGQIAQPTSVSGLPTPIVPHLPPLPPHRGPSDSQAGSGVFRPLDGLADAVACLTDGQPIYAVMQANANVRTQPTVDGCRLGRAPAGTLVRVEGLYSQGASDPLLSLNRRETSTGVPAVGYAEDIQPIFNNTCAICHGDLLQNAELKVTDYDSVMKGSVRGAVVVPGKPEESFLWFQIANGVMPLVGELSPQDKRLVFQWILDGAPAVRPESPVAEDVWLRISPNDYNPAANDCNEPDDSANAFINNTLVRFASCVAAPATTQLADYLPRSQQDGRGDVDKILTGAVSRPFGLTVVQGGETAAPPKRFLSLRRPTAIPPKWRRLLPHRSRCRQRCQSLCREPRPKSG